ncbi:alpha-ketoglutarate-dependent dioxygenase alkB homolog 4 isoform X2 [Octodon degus]|uniref:Alpha-ketoglutarate-dependent dioxygenase alkB homolog 4 isoform X2 n=1 Tax=Octodon degus TaxID=10160 RepID=A0A6P6ECZ6_OCTDE|nr:alpha-ketoglutarate-dependent dioxygenase alkB homolog 4 isoform X2 [Octodon degus]
MTAEAATAEVSQVFQECGCKGIRTCLICERQRQVDPPWQLSQQKTHHFLYCVDTGWAVGAEESDFEGWAFPFPGVTLIEDFVTPEEEAEMVRLMDRDPWKLSQSGRKKQDYGPRVNFRKQKLKMAGFQGLPSFSREVVRRMGLYPSLEGFQPVEQCNLDYSPVRGSAIDPHLDDAWLWGERLDVEVAIPVPRCSLLVLTGAARHQWTHAIHRRHITARRVCATFRELSAEFQPGGRQQDLGRELLQLSCSFQGRPM